MAFRPLLYKKKKKTKIEKRRKENNKHYYYSQLRNKNKMGYCHVPKFLITLFILTRCNKITIH